MTDANHDILNPLAEKNPASACNCGTRPHHVTDAHGVRFRRLHLLFQEASARQPVLRTTPGPPCTAPARGHPGRERYDTRVSGAAGGQEPGGLHSLRPSRQLFPSVGGHTVPLLFDTGSLPMSSSPSASPSADESSIDTGTAELLNGLNADQAALTISLGLLVQRAAEAEYILHGIYAHLGNVEKPYSDEPQGSVTADYINGALKRLETIPRDQIPAHARQALSHDLELYRSCFQRRNLFIHGCWIYDDDDQGWRVVKGSKPDQVVFPLIYSEEVHDLAAEFDRLNGKLIAWDAHFYGTPGDPESGLAAVSSKRLS